MSKFSTDEKITKFDEIFRWICYDIDFYHYLNKDCEGNFYVNKLYIEPKYLTYKTKCYELEKGLFQQVEKLYKVLHEIK